jgi:hypothetical protein
MQNGKNLTAHAQGASTSRVAHETSPDLLRCYQSLLFKSIDTLSCHHEIGGLSDMFSNLIYFLSHPEQSGDLDRETLLSHATKCIDLLGDLSVVYDNYEHLKHTNNE